MKNYYVKNNEPCASLASGSLKDSNFLGNIEPKTSLRVVVSQFQNHFSPAAKYEFTLNILSAVYQIRVDIISLFPGTKL